MKTVGSLCLTLSLMTRDGPFIGQPERKVWGFFPQEMGVLHTEKK